MGVYNMRVRKNKFNNKKTMRDNMTFGSEIEARYYDMLKVLRKKGVMWFQRQSPFHLPGGVRYVVDFQEYWKKENGEIEVRYIDVKGVETPGFIKNKKMVEALYPIEIIVVKRGDF